MIAYMYSCIHGMHNIFSRLFIIIFPHNLWLIHFCVALQMDGFVLPPFESTCVLKDKDTIRLVLVIQNSLDTFIMLSAMKPSKCDLYHHLEIRVEHYCIALIF
ncbi:uncharacterized protein A4U43_C04F6170 [Asparagus officinalis]|uniref:Uncharacterized protein n=1 Tax=Asparagus officinalis TaxID=4686 RepID=A0A5P1EYP7_ASPOF|nr:uncharacterized protein A4U43_C04F6170 [Asparagus officinalis]